MEKFAFLTLANLSKLPDNAIEGLRVLLKGGTAIQSLESALDIQRSLPHGHVAAVLGTLKNLGLESLIDNGSSRQRDASYGDDSCQNYRPKLQISHCTRAIYRYTQQHSLEKF